MGLTPKLETARRLVLAWGVHPVHAHDVSDFSDLVKHSIDIATREEFAVPGQSCGHGSVPFGTPGATNVLRLLWVD